MKITLDSYLTNSRRGGLTLIEVVIGLVLLSTLLAGLLLTHQRHERQILRARQKLVAVHAADQLLADWYASPAGPPSAATGPVPENASLWWETSVTDMGFAESLRVRTVRLIIRTSEAEPAAGNPLVDIELLAPVLAQSETAGARPG